MLEQVKPHGATPRNGFQVKCCHLLLFDVMVYQLKTIFKELHLKSDPLRYISLALALQLLQCFENSEDKCNFLFPPPPSNNFLYLCFYLVEALQDGSTDVTTPANDTEINSAINGILETLQKGSAAQAAPAGEGEEQSAKKTRRRSLMWQHFKRLEGQNMAQCQICMKTLQCFESGCTSNLHRHMSKRHPLVFSKTPSSQRQHPTPNSNSLKTVALRRRNEMMPGTI